MNAGNCTFAVQLHALMRIRVAYEEADRSRRLPCTTQRQLGLWATPILHRSKDACNPQRATSLRLSPRAGFTNAPVQIDAMLHKCKKVLPAPAPGNFVSNEPIPSEQLAVVSSQLQSPG